MYTSKKYGILIIIMAVIIFLGILTGCGKSDDNKKNSSSDGEMSSREVGDTEEDANENKKSKEDSESGTDKQEELSSEEVEAGEYKTPEYIDDDNDEAKNCKEKMIKLSGRKSDLYQIDEDCYYRGDRYIMYFRKGTVISGDCAEAVEEVMGRLEEMYGMSYNKTDYLTNYPWRRTYFSQTSFNSINTDNEKVNILVLPDTGDGSVEGATDSVVVLFDHDLDNEKADFCRVFHEMTHALRRRQGGFMGDIFEEGVALYSEEKLAKEYNLGDWTLIQYVKTDDYYSDFDDSAMLSDPVGAYKDMELDDQQKLLPEYHYGYRLVTFLVDNYGIDIIKKISDTSNKYDYDYGYVDIEIDIIKEATSDDVFDKFAQWVPQGWAEHSKEVVDYVTQFDEQ